MPAVVLYCWCKSRCISFFLYFTFLSHLFPLPCGAGSTVPREGFDWIVNMPFSGVLWLWHFLYSVGSHPVWSLHIYTFVVSRAFMAGAASQAGDADSSWALGLTFGLQGSVNVHRGALLLVPQWRCISSFVFYTYNTNNNNSILLEVLAHYLLCPRFFRTTLVNTSKTVWFIV